VAVSLPIYKQRRVVLVRFQRATTGDPDAAKPDIDDRGWSGQFGPIMGIAKGSNATVRLRRERIAPTAPLFAVPSDNTALLCAGQPNYALPPTQDVDLVLSGITGGNPKVTTLDIRHGSATGPIIHKLTVWIFNPLTVKITPHMVTIKDAANPGIASAVNIANIIDRVKAIWKPCGVDFNVQATKNDTHTFANAGVLQASTMNAAGTEVWGAEIGTLLSSNYVASTINAYFVNQIAMVTNPGLLGLGLSRATAGSSGGALPQPGIILGDTNAAGIARAGDSMWLANDLAHEIGHFFGLWHPNQKEPPNERKDTWCRRMLMHNFNSMTSLGAWRDTVVGYGVDSTGSPRRGCLVTMKDLPQITTDGEATTVRGTISSAAGPY